MSTQRCKGCNERKSLTVRQLRIYSQTKQFQFRIILCVACFGGLFDLIRFSADGFTEGLWNPLPTVQRGEGVAPPDRMGVRRQATH